MLVEKICDVEVIVFIHVEETVFLGTEKGDVFR